MAKMAPQAEQTPAAEPTPFDRLANVPQDQAYRLPKSPSGLYKEQTCLAGRLKPSGVIHGVYEEDNKKPKKAPFDRVLDKLPDNARPGDRGPEYGPMEQPNEMVWFEMNHRLHGILKKAGRRLESPRPFRVGATGGGDKRIYGIGEGPKRKQFPVRPVYVPAPLAAVTS